LLLERNLSIGSLFRAALVSGCAALATWGSLATPASAAKIEVINVPGSPLSLVMLSGDIVKGDSDRFYEVTKDLDRASIALSSPGGSVSEALSIGAQLRDKNFATMVLPDEECASACALIWVSSYRRYMSASSKIGFHAAYTTVNGKPRETGMGNAEIGSYLTHLGLRVEAIRFITHAPPDQIALLTLNRARALGIEVYEQDGFSVTPPSAKPTLDAYVKKATSYLSLARDCSDLFGLDGQMLRRRGEDTIKQGHAEFGGDAFGRLLVMEVDVVKEDMRQNGFIGFCLNALKRVQTADGQLVSSPSFDCGRAGTPTEKGICDNPDLIARDRAMGILYRVILSDRKGAAMSQFRTAQMQWSKVRNSCGSDQQCLISAYDLRLSKLGR
jgi:hypothetical protein